MLPMSFFAGRADCWLTRHTFVFSMALLAAAGCSSSTTTTPKISKDAGADNGAVDDLIDDSTEENDVPLVPDTVIEDIKVDAKDGVAGDADTGGGPCLGAADCKGKVTVLACQEASCVAGKCVAVTKAGSCCDDSACVAKDCSDVKCNLATALCEYKPQINCCPDKKNPLKTSFEKGTLEDFSAPSFATNGNVKWQTDTKRAHSGKSSLYFGNECHTYDNSMTEAKGCGGTGGTGTGVQTTLKSPELLLSSNMILQYWLWMDTEPTYANKGLPKGTCASACPITSSCVDLGKDQGGSQCIPEKDVLTVKVSGEVQPVWYSTQIAKTTGGSWQHFVVNLAKYAGQAVTIEWSFATTNGAKNNYEGIYLDDVSIETLCSDPGVLCGDGQGDCTVDGASPCDDQTCSLFVNVDKLGVCFHDKKPDCCIGTVDCEDNNTCTKDQCKINAGETQGVCANVPNGDNPACCAPTNLLTETFDAAGASWQHVGENSKNVSWRLDPTCGSNNSPGMHFSDSTFASYDDQSLGGNGAKGTICSSPIDLKLGTNYNVATFNLKMQTEWSGQSKANYKNPPLFGGGIIDQLTVTVFAAGQLVQPPLWTSDVVYGTTEGQTLKMSVDLDAFAGKTVQLCFTFDAGDATANEFSGVCIDDVKVDITCDKIECLNNTDASCLANCDPVCGIPTCNADHKCECPKIANCCTTDVDCDDKDSCTYDKCASGTCTHDLISNVCCSPKTPIQEGLETGNLPSGWKVKNLSGNAQGGYGKPYDQTIKWNVAAFKAKTGTYALYFGNNGTYNAGATVPAGTVSSPEFTVPANGTSLISFDLYLATEWDGAVFDVQPPSFVVDRMRVGLVDTSISDLTKATTWLWSSYDIAGTTNGHWQSVVAHIPEAWKGKAGKLIFEFDAGTDGKNNFEGAYIDNILVDGMCTAPGCVGAEDCQPPAPDTCKKFFCGLSIDPDSAAKTYACSSDNKPGVGCCVPSVSLPAETAEAGLVSWSASGSSTVAKWQSIPHKYLSGNGEVYFGNPVPFNYDDGAKQVTGKLTSKPFTLSNDLKKGAELSFKAWIDVEQSFEVMQITASSSAGKQVLWDKKTGLAAADYKALITRKIDLSKFKGQGAIVLSFEFDSQDGVNNTKNQGIFLDDIQVAEPCL